MPPQARVSRSMFLLLARRSPTMLSLANMSNDNGSIPYNKMTPVFFFLRKELFNNEDAHPEAREKEEHIIFLVLVSCQFPNELSCGYTLLYLTD